MLKLVTRTLLWLDATLLYILIKTNTIERYLDAAAKQVMGIEEILIVNSEIDLK